MKNEHSDQEQDWGKIAIMNWTKNISNLMLCSIKYVFVCTSNNLFLCIYVIELNSRFGNSTISHQIFYVGFIKAENFSF